MKININGMKNISVDTRKRKQKIPYTGPIYFLNFNIIIKN